VQLAGEPFEDHEAHGEHVGILIPAGAGRTFAVAIAGHLRDAYGQPLVGPRRPTFTTTRERFEAQLTAPSGLVHLDPRFEIPQWVVQAEAVVSARVQLYQVQPSDYFAFAAYERRTRATPPGRRIHDQVVTIGPRHGAEIRTDLRPALGSAGVGHVVAVVTASPARTKSAWFEPRLAAWIQVSRLGISARLDGEHLNAWVHDVSPARFLAATSAATTSLVVEQRGTVDTGTTASDGHVELALPEARPRTPDHAPIALVLAQAGADAAFVALDGRYERATRRHHARWYVTDDRFTYKPGEKVYVKGWVRWSHDGINPDLALPAPGETVAYQLHDPRGNTLASGTAPLSEHGGFDVEVALPANANLGTSRFTFTARHGSHTHPIAIQEFRTPAYAVALNDDVTHAGATPVVLGERIEMQATASYYAGGGLPGAGIDWAATLAPARYQPPGWDRFAFTPIATPSRYADRVELARTTSLAGDSTARITYGVAALPGPGAGVLTVDATVTDVDRLRIRASSRPVLVHPSRYYVGLRLQPRTTSTLEAIVTTIDGEPVPGVTIEVEVEGVLGSERDRDDAKVIDVDRCTLTSGVAPVTCAWTRKDHQTAYVARARVVDPRGRANGAQLAVPWYARDDRRDLAVVPDRAAYRPGDVARIEIRSRTVPAVAVVSFARQGVIAQRRVELATPSTIVELPIAASYLQNVHVVVDRWASTTRSKHPQPLAEHTSVEADLPVDVESARLEMRARPLHALVEPGARATFEVEVRRDGAPVPGAEVALVVVDEAVLALSGETHADPLAPFYRHVDDGTWGTASRLHDAGDELAGTPGIERYRLDDGVQGFGGLAGYGAAGGAIGTGRYGTIGHGSGADVVTARKDFRPTAVFSPRLRTDAHGKVRLPVTMPDSLTRFRIVALATADTRYFGKAESAIVTQRKINARTVAPRFLAQGDRFELPVVVQNLDAAPRTVDVAVRAANLALAGDAGKRVTIPGGQRAEVRFAFTTRTKGRAVVQTIAASGDFADASTVELPVYEPATTESFATYGIVADAPQFERLEVPADVFPDVGGVEVELASTQLQALTDAYWYLYAYPYECAEQRSSRMLATAAVYDILDAFATPGRPSRGEIEAMARADVARLVKDQLPDGGWGYFSGMRADPFVTMQVLAALAANQAGGPVMTKATAFVNRHANALLAGLEQSARTAPALRADRALHPYRVALAATALWALAAARTDVTARVLRLHAAATTLDAYPVDAKARVLALLANQPRAAAIRATLLRALVSVTHETAGAATVTTSYQDAERLLLVSSTKTTALALEALLREAPEHALVPKLARGLLAARERGRWATTQENLVVLAALRRYFDVYEKETPSYTGKLWFGGAAYAEQAFIGRSSARGVAQVDWSALPAGSGHDLALAKTGPGRMYYRIGITYAPKQRDLPALDAGFVVRRAYTAIDDPADVTKLADGRWKVRLGARVLVTVEALTTTKRHAVALVDPLPAGFEAVNDNLATAERAVTTGTTHWDFRNLRDNRSEVFAMDLAEGTHRFSYTARAITPGTYFAAPAKAEEMYSPETFGRSTGLTVVVE